MKIYCIVFYFKNNTASLNLLYYDENDHLVVLMIKVLFLKINLSIRENDSH